MRRKEESTTSGEKKKNKKEKIMNERKRVGRKEEMTRRKIAILLFYLQMIKCVEICGSEKLRKMLCARIELSSVQILNQSKKGRVFHIPNDNLMQRKRV